ncbi:hypothetical protein CSV75_12600 [Sporosarcina sp. P18a]|uniref:hypothetical protein n=1 Tax=Sporosarcina sp. P18a TaxID=2048259 RepID=UPI000C172F14|nr:hypothetical protein [Sporosarcina sp. P18a]PIC79425.1 hypothetical protein CSV75_12600 [Sporosarcina sp. P18a]
MRKLFVLLIVMGVLVGCGEKQLSYSDVTIAQVNADVKSFIDGIETSEGPEGNGIYMFNETEVKRYLYLNQDFLESGKGFGDMEIKTDENSIQIYLQENDEPTEDEYKLYNLTLDRKYEYMQVFKNDEETHFQLIGL